LLTLLSISSYVLIVRVPESDVGVLLEQGGGEAVP
jgi:hypothetical protein